VPEERIGMDQQTTWVVSAAFRGIWSTFVSVCVISFLCRLIGPDEAFDPHPVRLGVIVWGSGLALGILDARAAYRRWKRASRPSRGFSVIMDRSSKPGGEVDPPDSDSMSA
jgi:hypothetical protein